MSAQKIIELWLPVADPDVDRLVEYGTGRVRNLSAQQMHLLGLLTMPIKMSPDHGDIILGRGEITFTDGALSYGIVTEDHNDPNGIWIDYSGAEEPF